MSQSKLRAKLEEGRVYSFTELFDLLSGEITPERALATYRQIAKTFKGVRPVTPRDMQIVTGRRRIMRSNLSNAVHRGYLERLEEQDGYRLKPEEAQTEAGVGVAQVERWLAGNDWIDYKTLEKKATEIVDKEKLLNSKSLMRGIPETWPEKKRLAAGVRRLLMRALHLFRRRGLLDDETVERFRLRKFPKAEVPEDVQD